MTPVHHLRWRRHLDAFTDGELTERRCVRVAAHVASCPLCSSEARLTAHIKLSLAQLGLLR